MYCLTCEDCGRMSDTVLEGPHETYGHGTINATLCLDCLSDRVQTMASSYDSRQEVDIIDIGEGGEWL